LIKYSHELFSLRYGKCSIEVNRNYSNRIRRPKLCCFPSYL
jgi:hypothetical protein